MAHLPLSLTDWCSMHPFHPMNQNFALGLNADDLVHPLPVPCAMRGIRWPAGCRPWGIAPATTNANSTVTANKDQFEVNLDVQQFAPEEITVKVTNKDTITVEGKHEEKQDEHGFVSRHFIRRYILPKGHDISNVVSNLSSDGVLSISAPRVKQGDDEHRHIPIQQTGVPKKAIKEATKKDTVPSMN